MLDFPYTEAVGNASLDTFCTPSTSNVATFASASVT